MTASVLEYETGQMVQTEDTPGQGEGRHTHIVLIPKHLKGTTTPQAYVMEARINGTEIEALCGHKWIPQHNPANHPVCPKCMEIYRHDPLGKGDRGDLPDA